jgi:[ribosomal protein S5]-alanine N-acetyltransferase
MKSLDEIRTPRLLLTRMRPDDLDELIRMHRDPRVMATLGGVRTDEETKSYLGRHLAHWEQHGFGWWVAREPLTRSFIGRGGPRHATIEGRPEVEIGYGLMPEFWGRGLATELAREGVRVGFEELERPDLVCFTLPTNRASRRVMEKAGFRYERDVVHADLPHVLYRLARSQWQATATGPDR